MLLKDHRSRRNNQENLEDYQMLKSRQLRPGDGRDIIRLVGECRELGDDWNQWQEHWVLGLAKLADADLGFSGEVAGCRSPSPKSLSNIIYRGQPGFRVNEAGIEELIRSKDEVLEISESLILYFERTFDDDGAPLTNQDIYSDQDWYASRDHQLINEIYGTDPVLWCARSIPGISTDESLMTTVCRAKDRRKFTARDCTTVREAVAAIVPLMGGPLARFTDPSPGALAPRVRQVLACLLEGDSDKQVAARLRLSTHTVNQYTKVIYQHFGVRGRTELLARWIRRKWGFPFRWVD
jgi:DNA-binding CsgD family transcriptional regulator